MNSIAIGLLLPTSTIFPVSKDFEKGIKDAFAHNKEHSIEVEIIKEFTAQGSIKQTEDAVKRFVNYHTVDIVTGLVSNKVTDDLADTFLKSKLPFLANDTGGHIPHINKMNEYVFINSFHHWRHAWSLGKWGVENFGRKGMFVGAVYDAGYAFSQMFNSGMKAADPEAEWSFSVCPMPPTGSLSDVNVIFPFLEEYNPDFIFAAFCGSETTMFLNEFIARGWQKRTKVLGLPYLLSPFEPLNEDITIYTTSTAADHPELEADKSFYHLGYESGTLIAKAAATATSPAELAGELQKLNNTFHLSEDASSIVFNGKEHVTILKNDIKAGERNIITETVAHVESFPIEYNALNALLGEASFGWMNPYLCI